MTETTYTVPGAPRLALLSDLHGRPYREIIVSASRSNTASPIPRLKESSPAYPKGGHDRCGTIRLRLIKIAARVAHKARQLWFRLCSHCPYKDEFRITLENIQALQV